jgi:2-keto-4-pentenoate hydratase/2-oxohepta-3-ene-1,7-dioic acid hydratase in catechol pathway
VRLARYDDDRTGLVTVHDGQTVVVDVAASLAPLAATDPAAAETLEPFFASTPASWVPMIAGWDVVRRPLRALEALADSCIEDLVSHSLDAIALRAPLPDPTVRIFAAGGNYLDHLEAAIRASGGPVDEILSALTDGDPWGFVVLPGTIVGPDAVVTPPAWVKKFDYEAEVAVVLRAGGSSIRAADLEVWGYTAWNDFSIRDQALGLQRVDVGPGINWVLVKNFATGNACGPWMVVDDEPLSPGDIHFSMKVNGEQRQASSTAHMMHSYGAIAEWISGCVPLGPGDMILSGTSAGTAVEGGLDGPFLRHGDVTEVEVQGVGGILRNRIEMHSGI